MEFIILVSLFAIAFLYSSVGHGGASGYLALMALFSISPVFMRSTSLTLNVFVAGISFLTYARAGYLRWRIILPFLVTSIPMAYAGAMVRINSNTYEMILGIFLMLAVVRMLFMPHAITEHPSKPAIWLAMLIGALLGFFSGMIGIGGGIILSPILILFHWATVKESAAASALFILLNSISGLFALVESGLDFEPRLLMWIAAGVIGGISGSYIGSHLINPGKLKYVLATILMVASIKLIIF